MPAAAPISLKLSGTAVTGSSGCNSYGGSVQLSGDRISFGSLSQTDIGCGEPLATVERLFMAALARVERGTRDGASLRLSGSGVVLTFGPIPPTPDSQLVGTLWRLESIVSADTAMSASGSDLATLRFGADGILRGSTGCGDFAVRFAGDEASATIEPISLATDGCSGPFVTIGEAVRDTLTTGRPPTSPRIGSSSTARTAAAFNIGRPQRVRPTPRLRQPRGKAAPSPERETGSN